MRNWIQKGTTAILSLFIAFTCLAQEKKLDVDIDVGKEDQWYQRPWIWVIGAAVFILLLVALLKKRE